MFSGSGPGPVDPFVTPRPADDSSAIVMQPIRRGGRVVGYIQLAGRTHQGIRDFGLKLLQILVGTLVMGILSYLLGLSFSKHTLRPVHESQERLEQFTQDASHELRTPLASISSSLDVAMKTGEYRDGIMAAKGQVKYASLLVERLLEVAQLDRAKVDLGQVDLTALVTAVASQNVESCKEHELTMQATIHEGVMVEGDSLLLRQLVNNLIENAVKFNTPGGVVSVLLNTNDLDVGNSGGFIAPSDLSHVFEPFYQVDASRTQRGFGLGLAIVKKIADLHGWHVIVTSSAEAGTDFIVRFT
jgi:signal transduction histidine kinase